LKTPGVNDTVKGPVRPFQVYSVVAWDSLVIAPPLSM
jgi:hypothetical protein